jgi:hypothetical protein
MRRQVAITAVFLSAVASAHGQWSATLPQGLNSGRVWAVSETVWGGSFGQSARPIIWVSGTPVSLGGADGFGEVRALDGLLQGGRRNGHATLWSGAAEPYVDLHPSIPGATGSTVISMGAGLQSGNVQVNDQVRAALWAGTAASYRDVTPAGAVGGYVTACLQNAQGGTAVFNMGAGIGEVFHAGIWHGTAGSFIDLNPAGNWESGITGMTESEQVGFLHAFGTAEHATVWHGTVESRTDLHPFPGFGWSALNDTIGQAQVGVSTVPGFTFPHAGIWFGTASSFFDLHSLLPPGFFQSQATSIYQDAQRIVVGGSAFNSNTEIPVVWTFNIPAPGAAVALLAGALPLAARRRRPLSHVRTATRGGAAGAAGAPRPDR